MLKKSIFLLLLVFLKLSFALETITHAQYLNKLSLYSCSQTTIEREATSSSNSSTNYYFDAYNGKEIRKTIISKGTYNPELNSYPGGSITRIKHKYCTIGSPMTCEQQYILQDGYIYTCSDNGDYDVFTPDDLNANYDVIDGNLSKSCKDGYADRVGTCDKLDEGETGFNSDGVPICKADYEITIVGGEEFCTPKQTDPQITCPAGTVQTGTDLAGNPICKADSDGDGVADVTQPDTSPTETGTTTNADGSVTTNYSDGSSRTDYPDGGSVSFDSDGNITSDTRTPATGGTGTSGGGGGDTTNPDDGSGTGTIDRPCELNYYVSDCGDGAPSLKCTETTFTCDRGCDEVNYSNGDKGCVKGFECPIGTIQTGTNINGSPICHEDCDLDGVADIYDDDTSLCDTTNPDPVPPQEVEEPINDNSNLESSLDSLNSTAKSIDNNTQSIDSKLDTTNQTLEDIKDSLITPDEEKLNDLNSKFDDVTTDFDTFYGDMSTSLELINQQVTDYKKLFENGLEFTPIAPASSSKLDECMSVKIDSKLVTFDFITHLAVIRPITTVIFQIVFLIIAIRICVMTFYFVRGVL